MEQCGCNIDVMWNIVEECGCFVEKCGCYVEECGCFVDVIWNIVEDCGCFVETWTCIWSLYCTRALALLYNASLEALKIGKHLGAVRLVLIGVNPIRFKSLPVD